MQSVVGRKRARYRGRMWQDTTDGNVKFKIVVSIHRLEIVHGRNESHLHV
jgi:hypothetical protein